MILISPLVPPAAMAGRMGVAPLYFALITALSLFLLLQMTVSRYALVSEISVVSGFFTISHGNSDSVSFSWRIVADH